MHYQHFDPTACGLPAPAVPILPRLGAQTLGRGGAGGRGRLRPWARGGNVQSFTRGRFALTQAYRLAGVGPKAAILISAYHCRTMLDPAIRLGAPVVLYALRPDLSPDLAALARSVAHSPQPVKALLLTHYFGFAQDLGPVLDFCAQHGITLIEDCSHALFIRTYRAAGADAAHGSGQNLNRGMGQTGRYGVASPYKFFASQDGSLLYLPCHCGLDPQSMPSGLMDPGSWSGVTKTAPPSRMPPSSPPPTTRGTDTLEATPGTSPSPSR